METTPGEPLSSGRRGIDWAVVIFFFLAYLIAWGAFAFTGLIAERAGVDAVTLMTMGDNLQFGGLALPVPKWIVYLLTRMADFAFSIAGVIMIALTAGGAGLRELGWRLIRWRVSWKVYLAALLPLFFYSIATAVAVATDPAVGESFTFNSHTLRNILFSFQGGLLVTFFLRGPMGEELGLRGFALPRLQGRRTPFVSSLIIGLFWGLWHLPVLLGRDVISIVAFILLAFGLSFYFTAMFNAGSGSLIPPLLFHTLQNSEEIFEMVFPGLVGTDWELISTVLLLIAGVVAGVVVWQRGRPTDPNC